MRAPCVNLGAVFLTWAVENEASGVSETPVASTALGVIAPDVDSGSDIGAG